jgi:hydrogenase/urease accessory protein HupE
MRQSLILSAIVLLALLAFTTTAYSHGVTQGDKGYIQEVSGMKLIPFMYLGAKHMVTGYDHLLFLFAVVFFLYRMKHVAVYVSLFAIGHSTTMLAGVYFGLVLSLFDAAPSSHLSGLSFEGQGTFPPQS